MNAALPRLLVLAVVCGAASPATWAQFDSGQAAQRCEDAVAETVRNMRGRDAAEVRFVADERMLVPAPDDEVGVRGEGRYRAAGGAPRPFTYSCAYNTRSDTTSGVMFRESGGAPSPREPAWEPDLAHVSPQACEAATATVLRDKYPRAARIAFDSGTRQLKPTANARTSLEGVVAVERAPGMMLIPVTYRCVFEQRSGKVMQVDTAE